MPPIGYQVKPNEVYLQIAYKIGGDLEEDHCGLVFDNATPMEVIEAFRRNGKDIMPIANMRRVVVKISHDDVGWKDWGINEPLPFKFGAGGFLFISDDPKDESVLTWILRSLNMR
ncbi:hypothetical protein GGF41_000366 [Coemansia sp. RSA 2531]|nr:hypothetical protein GGF41_000366 [Coemansia sp. RSA 2531]